MGLALQCTTTTTTHQFLWPKFVLFAHHFCFVMDAVTFDASDLQSASEFFWEHGYVVVKREHDLNFESRIAHAAGAALLESKSYSQALRDESSDESSCRRWSILHDAAGQHSAYWELGMDPLLHKFLAHMPGKWLQ